MKHRFPHLWTLKEAKFTKDKGTVFSCFAGGGGSTLGYKLAGFDVVGCNEIDSRMMRAYVANNAPKYAYTEPIQTFKARQDLPSELYHLDILDGSPPCSTFSIAGKREKDWGKARKFTEGQAEQVLDTLFFDFIELAARLQPKVIVAENVKGITMGAARAYYYRILSEMEAAGYNARAVLLDASRMGVPQRRERVFFLGLRNDLAVPLLQTVDLFTSTPRIDLEFSEPPINYGEIRESPDEYQPLGRLTSKYWKETPPGRQFSTIHPEGKWSSMRKADTGQVLFTIMAKPKYFDPEQPRYLTAREVLLASTFPLDYNLSGLKADYIAGMSVPPVMIAQIASRIWEQWLCKIR